MAEREDFSVDLLAVRVKLTGKVMPNGERRLRAQFPGVSFHLTTSENGGWQEAHFHKGLVEIYTVLEGRIALILNKVHEPQTGVILKGDSITLRPGDSHNVYLFPDTVIITVTYGSPICNSEKGNADWWPAGEEFNNWTRSITEEQIVNGSWGRV